MKSNSHKDFLKIYGSDYKDYKNTSNVKGKEKESKPLQESPNENLIRLPFMENSKETKNRILAPVKSPDMYNKIKNHSSLIETPKETDHRNFITNPTINPEKRHRILKPSLEMPEIKKRNFITKYNLNDKKELDKKQEKSVESKYPDRKVNLKENIMGFPHASEVVEKFLHYTHKIEQIRNLISNFNESGNWLKNLRPTKTFITFLQEKQVQLRKTSLNNSPKTNNNLTAKKQEKLLSDYINLATKIRIDNALTKSIRNIILQNKGKYNAYDIQNWVLISDTSARNQLKRMFPNEKYQDYIRTQEYVSIKTIEDIAEKKGGICHTNNIKNAKSKIHLECAEGHYFDTSYDSVVYQKTWCPDCNVYVSETICRNFFVRIFEKPFPKSYPEWLINEKGNQMELDGYNKNLKVAFEYQGIQHRQKAFKMTEGDVKTLQKEDALKLILCKENDVTLIQVPDDKILPYNKMQNFIEKEYNRKTGKTLQNIPKFDYKDFPIYENKHAKKFQAYIEKKGGTLMTPYFTARKKVTLMCENGHQWTTTPDSVYKNNWCSECAGNMKGTAEFFQGVGKKFGCKLISEYINAKELLLYRCQKGHKFKKSPYWLKKDYKKIKILCPECKMDIYAKKFQNYVISKKEGKILTPYKGRFKTIQIRCKNNHLFKTTPASIYQHSWCPQCAKKSHPNLERKQKSILELQNMTKKLNYEILSKYENIYKKIKFKCPNQHQFSLTPKYFKNLVKQKIEPCYKCRKSQT